VYKLAICDDEIRTLKQLLNIIDWESIGFEVSATFANGKMALEYLHQNPLDAIIADIRMPVMDGLELAKNIQENFPATKVLLISAYRDFEYAHKAFKYDVVSYVTKPITQSDFLQALTKLKKNLDLTHSENQKEYDHHDSYISDNLFITDDSIPDFITDAIDFINKNYAQDISLEDVAKHTYMNPGYLSKLLKNYTNETYIDYLTKIRINKAKELLASTNCKVSAIGISVGYNYSQHFHKIFKKVVGITPIEYRKKAQESVRCKI